MTVVAPVAIAVSRGDVGNEGACVIEIVNGCVTVPNVLVAAKTPEVVSARLNQEIVRVINRADIKEKFLSVGTETVGSTSEQFAFAIKSEMTRLGKLIKDVGIRDE